MARPALTSRLDSALGHRLTALIAGPGSGKSTLLRAWRQGVRAAVWVPDADAGWATAAAAVVAAIERVVDLPDLSASWRGAAPEPESPTRRAHALAGELVEAIGDTELVLIIDDLDPVMEVTGVTALLTALVRQAPPTFHVVVAASRSLPEGLATLCGLELGGADLAFDQQEVAALLEAMHSDSSRAAAVMRMTGGWPLGVRLATESADPAPPDQIRPLVMAALEARSATEREFLAAACGLPYIDAALAAHLGARDSEAALASLLRHGVFLSPLDNGGFRVAALVSDIVSDACDESVEARRDRLGRAATWLEAHDLLAEALSCLISAGDTARLADALETNGAVLLRSGQVDAVSQAIHAVPQAARTSRLEMLDGDAHQVHGDWSAALEAYLRADRDASPGARPGLAWRIGLIHYLRGELDAALEAYADGVAAVEAHTPDDDALGDVALTRAWSAAAHWIRGDVDTARRLAEDALRDARGSGQLSAEAAARTALAMVAAADGDRAGNDAHYRAALDAAGRAGDALQLIRIHTNRASHFCEEGVFGRALEELEEAIHLADLAGERTMRSLALANRAEVYHRLGRLEEAVADTQEAERICDEIGTDRVVYPLLRRGQLASDRGDVPTANQALGRAIEIAERSADHQILAPALAAHATVLAIDAPARAEAAADRAVELAGGIARAEALVARAGVALHRRDRDGARRWASLALADARDRRDQAGQAEALQVLAVADPDHAAQHLTAARAIWAGLGCPIGVATTALLSARPASPEAEDARVQLARMGATGVATRVRAWRSGDDARTSGQPRVRLRLLGGLAVEIDGAAVPQEAWGSRKARLLLAYLVSREGRPVTRDEVADALWPEGELSRLGARLSVELSKLRKALGPARDAVVADRGSLHLVGEDLMVDVWTFLSDATHGLRLGASSPEGLERLRGADAAYTGEFLEEHPYEPWATGLRDRARGLAADVARALGQHAGEADPRASARYWRRVLERDGWAEDAHLSLTRMLSAAGRHGEARRAYQTYVTRMEELEAPVVPFPSV